MGPTPSRCVPPMPQATPTKARPAAPGKCAPGKPQALKGVGPGLLVNLGPFSCPYSTKCVEGEFSEVPPPEVAALYTKIGLLADAPNTECLLPWRIIRAVFLPILPGGPFLLHARSCSTS